MSDRDDNFKNELREKIASQAPETPDSLSRENITELVRNRKQKTPASNTKKIAALAASVAVVFVAAITGWLYFGSGVPKQSGKNVKNGTAKLPTSINAGEQGVHTADYAEIQSFFIDLKNRTLKERVRFNGEKNEAVDEAAALPESYDSSINAPADSGDGKGGGPASETELQVKGVDEADIVKTDGKYLYTVKRSDNSKVLIVDPTNPRELKIKSEIELLCDADYTVFAVNFYLKDNRLIVVVNYYKNFGNEVYYETRCCFYGSGGSRSGVQVYDITDKGNPQLVSSYITEGDTVSSRMIGDELVLISNYMVPLFNDDEVLKEACVPKYWLNAQENKIPADKISIVNGNREDTYTVVMKFNAMADSEQPETAAVLGGTGEVYCNSTDLYLARYEYEEMLNTFKAYTGIYRFELASLCFKSSVRIKGSILNQFSMDEYDGFFRVATSDANEQTYITVLDKELKPVGALEGIAEGESIYAVRFMGDKAYVVTFFQTDPLFIIDLSDPTAPKVTGELKIPGFSSMLYPYGDNYLIGIGIDGDEDGTNGNLKLSLFDISDKNAPKEVSKAIIPGYVYSEAMYSHKAFMRITQSGEIVIPVNDQPGYLCSFKIENGQISAYRKYICEDGYNIERGAYIGNTVFAITYNGIYAFDMETAELLSTLKLSDGNPDDIIVYNSETVND